ncbi:MAG: DNA (cytosine-5-)-methyltransferase [Ignavibacteriales bacterium]|nr:DNA (cytosine-5-)-methyltransferase [Ignavibacteriales bacterium]
MLGKLKVASLFCGCGGMEYGMLGGFEYLGKNFNSLPFEIVYAIDNDKYAAQIYNANFLHSCEIIDVKEVVAVSVPDHDILIGGFPCQSFSIVAQNPPRLGYKDDRGKLFFEMIKILQHKNPRFFIAENVKGLLSVNQKKTFPIIVKEFEQAGYHVKYKLLNASDYGVPQKRERIIIIGFRNFQDFVNFEFPIPTTIGDQKAKLRDVLAQSNLIDEKYYFSQKAVDGMMRTKEKMNKGRAQNLDTQCNTIGSHLAKISLNGTDPVLYENGRYRRFTPREAARIQSFSEAFKLESVSEHRQYRAIGNAVPPVLMWHICNTLVHCCINAN